MGMLIEGKWTDRRPAEVAGRFVRPESQFRNFITADGSSGFKAEPGRYHLYIAYNCPWAHRTLIFRKLKGLENMISIASAVPDDRAEGWRFSDSFPGGTPDKVNGFTWLHQAYSAAKPDYTGTCTTACTGPASPRPRLRTTRRWRKCSPGWTRWSSAWRAGATSSGTRSPR